MFCSLIAFKLRFVTPQILSELQSIVGVKNIVSNADDLLVYECDACVAFKRRPDVVVFPSTTQEASAIVKCAVKHNLNIVPRGAAPLAPNQAERDSA